MTMKSLVWPWTSTATTAWRGEEAAHWGERYRQQNESFLLQCSLLAAWQNYLGSFSKLAVVKVPPQTNGILSPGLEPRHRYLWKLPGNSCVYLWLRTVPLGPEPRSPGWHFLLSTLWLSVSRIRAGAPVRKNLTASEIREEKALRVWSTETRQRHHLGAFQKCRSMGLTSALTSGSVS